MECTMTASHHAGGNLSGDVTTHTRAFAIEQPYDQTWSSESCVPSFSFLSYKKENKKISTMVEFPRPT